MTRNKSSLFLMEMMIAILFFSLSATVCIRVFVSAHLLQQKTEDETLGVLLLETACERFRSCAENPENFLVYYPEAVTEETGVIIGFDEEQNPCSPEQANYTLSVTWSEDTESSLILADFTFSRSGSSESPILTQSLKIRRSLTADTFDREESS